MALTLTKYGVRSVTSTYAMTTSDSVVLADGTFTVTLPDSTSIKGQTVVVCNIGTGSITISRSGTDTIDGLTSIALGTHQSLFLTSYGAGWITNQTHFPVGYTERNRSYPAGEWQTVSYAAGDFTGSGTITWTVDSGDVSHFRYTTIGKTLFVSFNLSGTTVSGSGTYLQIKVPGGHVAAIGMVSASVHAIDNGSRTTAKIESSAGGTNLFISRLDNVNWAASTNNTTVQGTFAFQIQ